MIKKQGLYDPQFEHDNCGAGFICSLEGKRTNDIIHKALDILVKLEHRGAVSADGKTGDVQEFLSTSPMTIYSKYATLIYQNLRPILLGWFFSLQRKSTTILHRYAKR